MKRILTAMLCLLTISAIAAQTAEFRFHKTIDFAVADRKLVEVALDSEVYATCQYQFADVRIFNQANVEIPRLIKKSVHTVPAVTRHYFTTNIAALQKMQKNVLALLLHIRDHEDIPAISGLRIKTPLHNFEKKINVYAATDNAPHEWKLIAGEQLVYDYTRFADVRELDVRFAPGHYPRLRLEIHDVTDVQESGLMKLEKTFLAPGEKSETYTQLLEQRDFRIDQVDVFSETENAVVESFVKQQYPLEYAREDLHNGRKTILLLKSRREPLTDFQLHFADNNFRRPLQIKSEASDGRTRLLAAKSIYELNYEDFQQQDLRITVPETRALAYELLIDHEDNPALEITAVNASGVIYQLVFLADPAASYQLFYGNTEIAEPGYDTSTMHVLLQKGFQPVTAELGRQKINTDHDQSLGIRQILRSKWLLVGVIVLMAAGLTWALLHAARQIDSTHTDNFSA